MELPSSNPGRETSYSFTLLSSKLPQTKTKVVPRLNHDCFHPTLFQVTFHEESQPLYGLRYRQRCTIHHKDTSCIFPNFKKRGGLIYSGFLDQGVMGEGTPLEEGNRVDGWGSNPSPGSHISASLHCYYLPR
jgi:hypothetical protein